MKREGEVTVYLRLVKSKSTLLKKVERANLLALINLTAFASKGRGWPSCGGECGLPMFNSAGTPKLRSFAHLRSTPPESKHRTLSDGLRMTSQRGASGSLSVDSGTQERPAPPRKTIRGTSHKLRTSERGPYKFERKPRAQPGMAVP